jgi:hypothetical protein
LLLGVVMVATVVHAREACARAIFHGPEYVDEMFRWIHTGIGAESTPSQFIPQHLMHLAMFIVLALLTASLLSLLMGAALMNYMSFYVGNVILASTDFWKAVWMGWHPWSIVRVASFVVLGVILGEPLICRISGRSYDSSGAKKLLWLALAGIVADIAIKAALAPWWQRTLHTIVP